ncbi:hypothetical protein GCM10009745_63110 [Kribbella yunnanensis]|uniref:ABC transporter domain-containing protein n=1 Tax=Kribbella yunnanensis TaxID=190194 RepID=A0ABP4UMH9_9ACTN
MANARAAPSSHSAATEQAYDGSHDTGVLLRLESVTKSFPGVRALDDVSMDVVAGEVHGLVGENGAGKSTLMAVASGALMPDSGTVVVSGHEVGSDPAQIRSLGLSIVRQEPALMPDLTVAENLLLGVPASVRTTAGDAARWARKQLSAWSETVEIRPSTRVSALNPSQRFIVEITKALSQEPTVLVLDEPTEHLAREDVDRLFEKIRDVCSRGAAVVYISHRIKEVRQVAHRLTVLRDGQAQGTFAAAELGEQQIVDLIVGREVDTAFPAKVTIRTNGPDRLELESFSGPGFAPVDLVVRPGEIVGLAGIDGNGQREILRAVAGLLPSHGTVRVDGRGRGVGSTTRAARAGISYLPGDRHREGIFAELSVRENFAVRNLGTIGRLGWIRAGAERRLTDEAINELRVKTPSTETAIGSLSGGNQQKTVLAGVFASSPSVILADEPTQGVDIGARLEIYQQLRRKAADGTAVLVLSSDAFELAGLCDRVLIVSRGKVAAELTGDDVTERHITQAVLTATTTRDPAHRTRGGIWKALDYTAAPSFLIALAIIALGVFTASRSEFYLSDRNLGGVLALTATLALAAFGQQAIMMTGGIDLSVGPLMGLVVVIGSFYLVDGTPAGLQLWGWLLILTVPLGIGVLNWTLIDLVGLHPMVATLATFMGIQACSLLLRPVPDGLISPAITESLSVVAGPVPAAILVVGLAAVALEFLLFRSVTGMRLRGVGSQAEAARVAGVRGRRVRLVAHLACSAFAGLAGITLMAQIGSGDANAGTNYTLQSIAAVVIGGASIFGGRGSFVGALMGALLLTQVSGVTTFLNLNDAWQSYLLGGLTILAVTAYSLSRRRALAR